MPTPCLVLANPPFKGTIDKESISPGLQNVTNTAKTELLFLALMLRMLKTGGRCAVIVPDGVLFGSGKAHKSLREEIVANNKLEAVISMPSGVFKPYAGVSTAILIFTKTGSGGTDNVWFYDMLADGKSLDDKRNLLVDEDLFASFTWNGGDISDEEKTKNHKNFNIPDIIERFHSLNISSPNLGEVAEGRRGTEAERKRTHQSFLVPFTEIQENDYDLSINRYKEIVYEEVQYDQPEVILERIEKLDEERTQIQKQLEGLLK